jgi:hypothetical protein
MQRAKNNDATNLEILVVTNLCLESEIRRGQRKRNQSDTMGDLRTMPTLQGKNPVTARRTKAQKNTIKRVMHEFKEEELETSGERKVKDPKQAIAIALREAGASKYESPEGNRKNLRRTEARERGGASREKTRAELYAEAKRRNIPQRSKMTKEQLERALR